MNLRCYREEIVELLRRVLVAVPTAALFALLLLI